MNTFEVASIAYHLRETGGNISAVAKRLSLEKGDVVSRASVKTFVDSNPLLLDLLAELREEVIDEAETNIHTAVRVGKIEESKFVLRTIGRERGYVTKVETQDASAQEILEAMRRGRQAVRASEEKHEAGQLNGET